MNYHPIPCQFCDQFYDHTAQRSMDVYCADQSCYCPYGCGRLYNKAYLYQLRDFFPHGRESNTKDGVDTHHGHHNSIPPPLREGTPLPPPLGRYSKNEPSSSESWRISKSFPHKEFKRNSHELNNGPATRPYFGIQTQTKDDFVGSLSSYSSDSANFKEFSFDHIPIGASNDIHTNQDNANIPPRNRLRPNRATMNRTSTFEPSSNYYAPSLAATSGMSSTNTPSSSAAVVDNDIPPQLRMIKNAPSVNLSDYASQATLLLQEMRSMRQSLERESAALTKMSKYHKKTLILLDKCTKQYVNNVEYIQQLKYDMEKIKQDMEDRDIEIKVIQSRQNELVDQHFRNKKKKNQKI
ncbi:unnamed protein product [Absidia cylindrospora]